MSDIMIPVTEKNDRDLFLATIMLFMAVAVFHWLDNLFAVANNIWYSLIFVALSAPFLSMVLYSRAMLIKIGFLALLTTAVFLF